MAFVVINIPCIPTDNSGRFFYKENEIHYTIMLVVTLIGIVKLSSTLIENLQTAYDLHLNAKVLSKSEILFFTSYTFNIETNQSSRYKIQQMELIIPKGGYQLFVNVYLGVPNLDQLTRIAPHSLKKHTSYLCIIIYGLYNVSRRCGVTGVL